MGVVGTLRVHAGTEVRPKKDIIDALGHVYGSAASRGN